MIELPYEHQRQGRNTTGMLVVLGVYATLLAAVFVLNASLWVVGIIVVFTLPALWDLATDRISGLTLNASSLTWRTGKRSETLALNLIRRVRFDTRLDFSVRVTLILASGQKIRVPYECLPPHKELEEAFRAVDINVERHHFALLQ